MATGLGRGWTAAPTDVPGAGDLEWVATAGVPPGHPLVSGAGAGGPGYDVDASRGLVVTQDIDRPRPGTNGANIGGASDVFDDWRDLIDFKSSPVPYVVLGFLVMIGMVAARVELRGGSANLRASLG